jgi:hypothetical protein
MRPRMIGLKPHGFPVRRRRSWVGREATIELLDTYMSVLAVTSAGLLLLFSGFAKMQLAWRMQRATFVRRKRPSTR